MTVLVVLIATVLGWWLFKWIVFSITKEISRGWHEGRKNA